MTPAKPVLGLILTIAISLAGLVAGFSRDPIFPSDLDVVDGIVFKEANGTSLDLALFRPLKPTPKPSPMVVYIHGGGWGKGDKYKVLRPDVIGVIRALNEAGIACASIEYRLADGGDSNVEDSVADCKDALRFLASHAEDYQLDPDYFAVFGSSAGAHLSMVTAFGKDADYPLTIETEGAMLKVRCVAAYYGLASLVHPELLQGSNFERPQRMIPLIGGLVEEKRALAEKLSPLLLMEENSPALFLAHGDADEVLNYRNSLALRDQAEKLGVPVDCVISKGATHGFGRGDIEPPIVEINQRTVEFFLKYLGKSSSL